MQGSAKTTTKKLQTRIIINYHDRTRRLIIILAIIEEILQVQFWHI